MTVSGGCSCWRTIESAGAAEHIRCAHLSVPRDAGLLSIGCDVSQTQHCHEDLEFRITRHARIADQACGWASNGGWSAAASVAGVLPRPWLLGTKLDAMN